MCAKKLVFYSICQWIIMMDSIENYVEVCGKSMRRMLLAKKL